MSVRIKLDDPHAFYTNLDYLSGKVVLSLANDENVSAIVVKLEGESITMLMRPLGPQAQQYHGRQNQRQGVAREEHKILYKVQQVFPGQQQGMMGGAFALRAGNHEFPFKFKIPFNNGCAYAHAQQIETGGLGGLGLGRLQQMQYPHVKKTLPPSLTGFPDEAEIRYYVKVTVQRPSIFKENHRSAIGFKFLPIEPPRPPPTSNEVYARRPFAFQAGLAPYSKRSSLFSKKTTPLSDVAPQGELDARLPSPAVLTCNAALPLRLILRKLNESQESVFMMSLQVHLFGHTEVRAQGVTRTETSTWILVNLTGLSIPLGKTMDPVRTETTIDDNLWKRIKLPNTVAPSFDTCNLSRSYELEAKVGLGYGHAGQIQVRRSFLAYCIYADIMQPQTINLPLRFKVEIYSGISPPEALLTAMAAQPVRPVNSIPVTVPIQAPPAHDALYPPQLGTPAAAAADDAPPSYEDAMADNIELAPADGPRFYSGVTDVNAPSMDEKGGSGASSRYSVTNVAGDANRFNRGG